MAPPRRPGNGPVGARGAALQRLQVLDEVGLLGRGEPQALEPVVVIHHVLQGRDAAVVVEAVAVAAGIGGVAGAPARPPPLERGGAQGAR